MSFSVSTSGVESGRMGMGLSIRLSWASLLKRRSRSGERGEMTQPCFFFKIEICKHHQWTVVYLTFSQTWSSPVCSVLCSFHSGHRRSRLWDRACAIESACSSVSQSHNATGSPLTKGLNKSDYGIQTALIQWWDLWTYLQQSPRGTVSLSLSALEPPPLYYCQSQQTGCTPAHTETWGCVLLAIICPKSFRSVLALVHLHRVLYILKRPWSSSKVWSVHHPLKGSLKY